MVKIEWLRGLMAVLCLGSLSLLMSCTETHELSEQEKAALVTELDLMPPEDLGVAPRGAFAKETDYLNQSTGMSYQTEAGEGPVYVYNTVSIERSFSNSLTNEFATKGGLMIGLKSEGIEEVPIRLTKQYGSRSSLSKLMKDGRAIGNAFNAVIGKKFVVLVFSGIYFESAEEFQQFIDGKMRRIEALPEK